MSDQGILGVQPTVTPAAPPPAPPAPPQRVEGEAINEEALVEQALAALRGEGDAPGEELDQGEQPMEAGEGEAKPEPKAQPKPEEELTQKKLSAGFAKLREQEDRLDRRYKSWQAEQATKEAELAAREARFAPLEQAQARAASSPLEALKLLGWEFEQLAKYVMEDGKVPQDVLFRSFQEEQRKQGETLQQEIARLKQEKEAEKTQALVRETEGRMAANVGELLGGETTKYPHVAKLYKQSPERVMVDVKNLVAQHWNETCVRDAQGRIVKPGEAVAPERALVYIERILSSLVGEAGGNPAQRGAVQSAQAGAEKPSPKPLVPRDYSDAGMPSDQEIEAMTDEQREALAVRIVSGA